MKSFQIFTFLALTFISSLTLAQAPSFPDLDCGTDSWMEELFDEDSTAFKLDELALLKQLEKFRSENSHLSFNDGSSNSLTSGPCPSPDYILPVVVHVIHHSSFPNSKIDSNQIFHQIELLNKAFSNASGDTGAIDTKIQFCLAKVRPDSTSFNGINYIQDNTRSIHSKGDLEDLLDTINYPSDRYINIFIVKEIDNGSPSILAGYSSMPYPTVFKDREGIVMAYDWFGDYSDYGSPLHSSSKGKVLIHEMGHYLGLYHPWRGGCNIGNCSKEGDLCCDVPQIPSQNQDCQLPQASCTTGVYEQVENYMGYSEPNCKRWFTSDQAMIMHTQLNAGRSVLDPYFLDKISGRV